MNVVLAKSLNLATALRYPAPSQGTDDRRLEADASESVSIHALVNVFRALNGAMR